MRSCSAGGKREASPTPHNYGLGLWQDRVQGILAGWVGELGVSIYRGREVTRFAQDDTGVDIELSDVQSLRAEYHEKAGCSVCSASST